MCSDTHLTIPQDIHIHLGKLKHLVYKRDQVCLGMPTQLLMGNILPLELLSSLRAHCITVTYHAVNVHKMSNRMSE